MLDPERPVEPKVLARLVADSLASYKQVRQVVGVDSIPRFASGKTIRRQLRDRWLAGDPGLNGPRAPGP